MILDLMQITGLTGILDEISSVKLELAMTSFDTPPGYTSREGNDYFKPQRGDHLQAVGEAHGKKTGKNSFGGIFVCIPELVEGESKNSDKMIIR